MAQTGVGRYGCLFLLLLAAVLSLEVYVCLELVEFFDDDLLAVLIGVFAVSLFGYMLLRWRMRRLRAAMLAGRSGRQFAAIAGCVLLVIPGPITAVPGLLLQIPPVQALCAAWATRIAQAVMRRAVKRMLAKDGADPFPGGLPRSSLGPDRPADGGRTYDVEGERVDGREGGDAPG